MLDATSPEFAKRVDVLSKVLNATIQRIDNEPSVMLAALLRTTAVNFVAENFPGGLNLLRGTAMHAMAEQIEVAYTLAEEAFRRLPSNEDN